MDDDTAVPYYCISQLRCSLCRFNLQDGEWVVAGVDQQRFSSKFPFRLDATFYDDDIFGIKFHMCGRVCAFRGRRVPCLHGQCFDFRLLPITQNFLRAFEYSTQSSLSEEQRRFDRTWRLLQPRLSAELKGRLPAELMIIIAKLLVRECALVTYQEQALEIHPSTCLVNLHSNVYAQFQVVDGVRYVKSLRNSKPQQCEDGGQQLLDTRKTGTVKRIMIADDHLGIRLIRFVSSYAAISTPGKIPGVWWRVISRHGGITGIRAGTDGLKLRDITCDPIAWSGPAYDSVRWATPNHPGDILDLVTLRNSHRPPTSLRMRFFDCNAPDSTGYSVATDGVSIATIHTHGQGSDSRFYMDLDPASKFRIWIYMPLDPGEFVTEISRDHGIRHLQDHSIRLIFTTNRGRSVLFGCYTPVTRGTQVERIHTFQQTESRVFFNAWDSVSEKQVRYMAFEGTCSPATRPYPVEILPTRPFPCTQYNEPWFFSSCNMQGVAEITLCRDVSSNHEPIMGMQLRYNDGHRACLGQFRFDMALEVIPVDQSSTLHIGSRRTRKSFLYVADVTTRQPDSNELAWLDVNWDGKLEWWFSSRHTVLRWEVG